jgi:hypothetical protein
MYYTNSRVLENWYKSLCVEVIIVKSKLLTLLIIVAVMLPFFASSALAAPKVVDITSPGGNEEVVTKELFSICGVCIFDDTTIAFEYKDKDSGKYKELLTIDGESSFKVGSSKMFGKSIELKYKGVNEIKVIAFTKTLKDENYYTITFNEEKKKSSWLDRLENWLVGPNEKN